MRTKNAVSLIGMVGKDAEVRQTNGVSYARFSLATSTGGYKKQDGSYVPETTQWHNIVVWRNLAEFAGKWVKKGMKVAVDGMITYGEYTDKQGVKVHTVEILGNDMVLMTQPQQPSPQTGGNPAMQPAQTQGYSSGNYQQSAQPVQNVQSNLRQGGNDEQSPFPPPVGADGLPF